MPATSTRSASATTRAIRCHREARSVGEPPVAVSSAITTNPLVPNQAQGDYYEKIDTQFFLGLSVEDMGIGIGSRGAGFGVVDAEVRSLSLVVLVTASAAHLTYLLRLSSCVAGTVSAASKVRSLAAESTSLSVYRSSMSVNGSRESISGSCLLSSFVSSSQSVSVAKYLSFRVILYCFAF